MLNRIAKGIWAFVMICLFLTTLLLIGCDEQGKKEWKDSLSRDKQKQIEYITRTIEHDGHKFVTMYEYNAGTAIIHHPGCSCLKKALDLQ